MTALRVTANVLVAATLYYGIVFGLYRGKDVAQTVQAFTQMASVGQPTAQDFKGAAGLSGGSSLL